MAGYYSTGQSPQRAVVLMEEEVCTFSSSLPVNKITGRFNWVPVSTACNVLRMRMEEWLQICRVAANILEKQLRTVDKGLFSSI
jgi:hypothetical protein